MESIYYVAAWACHRRCDHCYEDRFRPYVRGALEAVVREAEQNFPRIVDHLPELTARVEGDVLPVLTTLGTVAPDMHDLLTVARELNDMLAKIPGMGRIKRRVDEEEGEDHTEETIR